MADRPPSRIKRARAVGQRIKELRDAKGWTQAELGLLVHLDDSSVSRIETGEVGPPEDETLEQFAAALDVDALELMHLAGRALDPESFQERVLAALDRLAEDQRAGFARIDAALAGLAQVDDGGESASTGT